MTRALELLSYVRQRDEKGVSSMNVSRVVYSRLVNTGNYENERFEVEVILERNESSDTAFNFARISVAEAITKRMHEIESKFDAVDEDLIPY